MKNVHFIFVTEKQLEQIGMTYDELMLYGVDMKHDNFVYLVDEDYNLDETLGEEMIKNVGICWKAKDFSYGDFMVTYFGISNQEGTTKNLLEDMGTTRDDLLTYLRWMTELNDKANQQNKNIKQLYDRANETNTEVVIDDTDRYPGGYVGMLNKTLEVGRELSTYQDVYRLRMTTFERTPEGFKTENLAWSHTQDEVNKEAIQFDLYFDTDSNPTHHKLINRRHN